MGGKSIILVVGVTTALAVMANAVSSLSSFRPDDPPGIYYSTSSQIDVAAAFSGLLDAGNELASTFQASLDKMSIATQELVKSEMIADSTRDASKGAADAVATYGTEESTDRMCALVEGQVEMSEAKVASEIGLKADLAVMVNRNMSGPGVLSASARRLDEHNNKYCSEYDAVMRRCKATGSGLGDADIKSTTIFNPSSGLTASEAEYQAGLRVVENVTAGMSQLPLPASLEKGEVGIQGFGAQMEGNAVRSMVERGLTAPLANRMARN